MNGRSVELQRLEASLPNPLEWRYEMRREAQMILPGLFIGPFQPSWNLETLNRLQITHILCIAESREQHLFKAKFPERFTYRILEVRDADDQNLIRILPDTQSFIDGAIGMGGAVLVHCGDGMSRSPAIAAAYVMVKHGLTHEEAFQFVQSRRFCIAPRIEFQHQIEAYAPIFEASQTMALAAAENQGSGNGNQRSKRRERDDDDGLQDESMDSSMGGNGMMETDHDMFQRVPLAPQWEAA